MKEDHIISSTTKLKIGCFRYSEILMSSLTTFGTSSHRYFQHPPILFVTDEYHYITYDTIWD